MSLFFLPWFDTGAILANLAQLSESFAYPRTESVQTLRLRAEHEPIHILIVPGHDALSPGAEYEGVSEADLNIAMTKLLVERFSGDNRFIVSTTRDLETGDYMPDFQFSEEELRRILRWRDTLRARFKEHEEAGRIARSVIVHHNSANERVSGILYGINRFANMHDIDIVLHVHFNDYPRTQSSREGKYSGFSLYIPDPVLPNAEPSRALAESIFARLEERFPSSDLPKEDRGIIPSQDLIAVGSNASRRKASLLVEYGYIYERQFVNRELRNLVLRELAYQTYVGVTDFFDGVASQTDTATTLLPYLFERDLHPGLSGARDVLHLQAALHALGWYPPKGRTLSECPINGSYGPCVSAAVRAFQDAEDLSTVGIVGPQTRERLNTYFMQ